MFWLAYCLCCFVFVAYFLTIRSGSLRVQKQTPTNATEKAFVGVCLQQPSEKGARVMKNTQNQSTQKQENKQDLYQIFFTMRSLQTSQMFGLIACEDTPRDAMDGLLSLLVEACCAARRSCEIAVCSVLFDEASQKIEAKGWQAEFRRQRLACAFWLERNKRMLGEFQR